MRISLSEVKNTTNYKNVQNSACVSNSTLLSMPIFDTISFKGIDEPYQNGLSITELKRRTAPEYFEEISLLGLNTPEFEGLLLGDKTALAHLTKAAYVLDKVYQKQDHPSNIGYRTWLRDKELEDDEASTLAIKLYDGQKGIIATDHNGQKINLMKGEKEYLGCGVWPFNIKIEEIKQIINKMLDDNQIDEVKSILSSRTVVKRDKNKLKGIDYTQEYRAEYQEAVAELEAAAKTSTNPEFSKYLYSMADALIERNPLTEAKSDMLWARIQDAPLEFSITRESYADSITDELLKDSKLAARLKAKRISAQPKDFIGCRVGIVNPKGTAELKEMELYSHLIQENMPYKNMYPRLESKQTTVDVDLVALTGESGAYRGGIATAQNSPNTGCLALEMGGWSKNVHHRQLRFRKFDILKRVAHEILVPELSKGLDLKGYYKFVQIHERTHSEGPQVKESHLGSARSVIEELKADMGIDVVRTLAQKGYFGDKQRKGTYVGFVVDLFYQLSNKPSLDDAHRVRALMQINHYIDSGAIILKKKSQGLMSVLDSKRVVDIDFEKFETATRELFEKAVKIQINDNALEAKDLIDKKFVWTSGIDSISKSVREVFTTLHAKIKAPLAEDLLRLESRYWRI